MNDVLYIIAKAPRVGLAKTRLGASIGHEEAIELYKAFLRDISNRFSGQRFGLGWFITPPDSWPEISALTGEADRVLLQEKGDLTDRQRQLFRGAPTRGERAVLIGSDAPHLSIETIEEAFEALDDYDLVFLPTHDGGYCLIAMSGPHEEVLEGVEMSTGSELGGIIARAENFGLKSKLLESTFDVDVVEDLVPLRDRALAREDLVATREVLQRLRLVEEDSTKNPETSNLSSEK